jgi:GMP synthase (glutamine-hydrolysing)
MPVLGIQNCDLEGFGRYATLLDQWGVGLEVVRPYSGDTLPPWSTFDALMVGGTPLSACELEQHGFLRVEFDYLEDAVAAGVPSLGICCGAQLLARVLGAEVRRCDQMEIGCFEVSLTDAGVRDDVLGGFPRTFPVFQWHGDMFELPGGAQLLASADACRNQMFRAGSVVGVIFHVEVAAGDVGAWADLYRGELGRAGKTKPSLIAECLARDSEMADLAQRLVGNFLRSVAGLPLAV